MNNRSIRCSHFASNSISRPTSDSTSFRTRSTTNPLPNKPVSSQLINNSANRFSPKTASLEPSTSVVMQVKLCRNRKKLLQNVTINRQVFTCRSTTCTLILQLFAEGNKRHTIAVDHIPMSQKQTGHTIDKHTKSNVSIQSRVTNSSKEKTIRT
jgi:hypothetical protein